ncbi:conjugal transfer protein TrbG (plasmid) [Cupriavidus sp. USMAA2-4]|uniref:TrbG/VirB9 family P-type conjugative transfer protein n=1 Tax=Cupriavidus sp. USMAA2-4 TaxID=876364 RepID=UPI0008A6A03A|nr:TrbG/VirB9 family P-type conjugative transfer protein [Cupriavidus sp. USMAA2-4]AOY97704.1 conjugal transfer protein TrbG [Cupriavidus sp. USMAA2-4]
MRVPQLSRRTLVCALLAASVASVSAAAPAKLSPKADSSLPRLGLGDMADAMNPANPFNMGADPVAMPGDSRLVVFTFSRDQIFRVLCAPLKGTTIELGDDEQLVTEPVMGDTVRWEMTNDGANHIYLKPHAPGLVNTLSLSTNKRSYEFTLVSSPLGGIYYQKVRFRFPDPGLAKIKPRAAGPGAVEAGGAESARPGGDRVGVAPDKLNFDYRVSGNAEFKPEAVFDDGKFLWMRMPSGASEWPVALIKDGSDYVVANFIRRGGYLVLQRLADEVALRSGDTEVLVRRGKGGIFGGLF